jgi:hypothetical protein
MVIVMTNSMGEGEAMPSDQESRIVLRALLERRLATVDLTRAMRLYPTPEALAARMIDSLPDQFMAEPLLGPCYSTAALARWRRLTRQAVTRQREVGTLFAIEHKARFYFPSVQFDARGRQTGAFRELWAQFQATGGSPLAFGVWLQTSDPEEKVTPASRLAGIAKNSPRALYLEDFTMVDPPARLDPSQTGAEL